MPKVTAPGRAREHIADAGHLCQEHRRSPPSRLPPRLSPAGRDATARCGPARCACSRCPVGCMRMNPGQTRGATTETGRSRRARGRSRRARGRARQSDIEPGQWEGRGAGPAAEALCARQCALSARLRGGARAPRQVPRSRDPEGAQPGARAPRAAGRPLVLTVSEKEKAKALGSWGLRLGGHLPGR